MTTILRELRYWTCMILVFLSVLIGLYFASIGEIVHALLSIIVFTLFYIAADVIWILTEIQEFREKEQPKGRKKKK